MTKSRPAAQQERAKHERKSMSDTSGTGRHQLLLVHSHFGDPPVIFDKAVKGGNAVIIRELGLRPEHFAAARGLITTTHLDQPGFMAFADELQALLQSGG